MPSGHLRRGRSRGSRCEIWKPSCDPSPWIERGPQRSANCLIFFVGFIHSLMKESNIPHVGVLKVTFLQ